VKVGDRVAYADAFGAYTTVRLYPEDRLTLIPDGSNRRPGSQQPAQGIDSTLPAEGNRSTPRRRYRPVPRCSWWSGSDLHQWARSLGIHVIGTVSTAEKAQIALQAGCKAAVNYSTEDFVERTIELTGGQGVKAVYDSVGRIRSGAHSRYSDPAARWFNSAMSRVFRNHSIHLSWHPERWYLTWAILPHYNNTPEALAGVLSRSLRRHTVRNP